jgi:hypothetical protein
MAKHSFSVDFPGAAQDIVAKAKGAIEKVGGKFIGDEKTGDFTVPTPAGAVKGVYTITAQKFAIDITDKPMLVSGGMIEGQVRKFLGG